MVIHLYLSVMVHEDGLRRPEGPFTRTSLFDAVHGVFAKKKNSLPFSFSPHLSEMGEGVKV